MKTLNKLATRRLLLAILTIAPLLAVTSCKDEMDYYEKPYVTLSPNFTDNTIPFKQDGGKQELTIETNRRFSITFGEGAEWVSATPMEATEGTHQIAITALPNRSEDAREAQMIIKTSTTQHVYLIMQLGSTGKGITYTSLAEIAKLGEGLDQNGKTIDQDLRIRATVTTHAETKQLPFAGYHHIQDAEGNALVLIVPKGKGEGALQFGDEVTAKLKGAKISNYKGTIQLQVSHAQMSIVPNKPIEPIETTLAEIVAGKHPNQYVRVKDVQFVKPDVPFFDSASAPSTRHKLVDKSGNEAELDVWKTATFGEEKVPSGSGSITAVVTVYKSNKTNKTFFNLRPTLRSDIKLDQPRFDVGGGNQPNPNPNPNPQGNVYGVDLSQTACTIPFADDFSKGGEDKKDFTLPGWLNKALVGTTLKFQNGSYGGVHFALASAFKSTEPENKFVLVTPRLQMKAGSSYTVDLTYSTGHTNGATLTIQQLDKDGKLVKTLEVINDQSSPNGFGNQHYKKSYTITGSADAGYIALLYEASQKPLHTTTYQVEALTVK
ncbi:hypothetical protein PORUE0001_0286 [Porphyromonas uenonis 60-3]|uniref:Uncharacterized protein n=1 Tax=Porphyromonas uenonis 60-3 TaxID=596327 RepID=C2M931_9PORP|nr:DUF5689 domain-containing protein [Porphyromonas uenonis]EEK17765.1 hypothetical protein PORUE0001_0286 [Porphyromonas uenonis 60-3]